MSLASAEDVSQVYV